MKILKYENNVSYLYVDGKYKKLLEISKEDILKSLEYIYENEDVELEEYDKEKIVNEAEKIVYENLYNKLNNFKEDKPILKNEIDNLFKELEEKYKIRLQIQAHIFRKRKCQTSQKYRVWVTLLKLLFLFKVAIIKGLAIFCFFKCNQIF